MHNIIVEDEREMHIHVQDYRDISTSTVEIVKDHDICFRESVGRYRQIKNEEAHFAFRNDLVDHLWEQYENSND